MYSDEVKFHPWVGTQYGAGSMHGLSLLILGESHYDKRNRLVTKSFTWDLCKEYAEERFRHMYWTNLTKAILGIAHNPDGRERYRVWHSLAFYNYIQEIVGNGPNIRPQDAMWERAKEPLKEVLASIKPDCILVVGRELWDHLRDDISDLQQTNDIMHTGTLGSALAGGISHVSRGFKPLECHQAILDLLFLANDETLYPKGK